MPTVPTSSRLHIGGDTSDGKRKRKHTRRTARVSYTVTSPRSNGITVGLNWKKWVKYCRKQNVDRSPGRPMVAATNHHAASCFLALISFFARLDKTQSKHPRKQPDTIPWRATIYHIGNECTVGSLEPSVCISRCTIDLSMNAHHFSPRQCTVQSVQDTATMINTLRISPLECSYTSVSSTYRWAKKRL